MDEEQPKLAAPPERLRLPDDRGQIGEQFADPNVADDRKLGHAFEESESSRKKKRAMPHPHMPKSRKPLYWTLAAMLLAALLFLLVGVIPRHTRNKEAQQHAAAEQNAIPVVEAVRVSQPTEGVGLVIPGTTTPYVEATVYARASGYLKRRLVDIGDHVHRGQLLAVIDAPDLDQQVDQARQQLGQAEALKHQQDTQLALTKVTLDRYAALVARGVFSRQEGDQRAADFANQQAADEASGRNVEAFRANLRRVLALQSYERVTAPFDGVVTQRNVDTGAFIGTGGSAGSAAPPTQQTSGTTNASSGAAGATNTSGASGAGNTFANPTTGGGQGGPLFAIAQTRKLRILVSVPEGYAGQVAVGQHTQVHFQELPGQTFFGDVKRTSAAIDQNSRTLLTEVQVDNRGGKLLAGMYAVVTFAASKRGGGEAGPVLISGDSVAIRNDRPTVAVIGADDVIHLVPVLMGRDFGPEVEILSGLKPGDLIASTFNDDVRQNAKVTPHENKELEQKASSRAPAEQRAPPGGGTQYGDPGITDQTMQGQAGKPGQKQGGGGSKGSGGGNGGKP